MITVKFNVGDRVAYTKQFLQSIGAYTGELPRMRGTVLEIMELRGGENKAVLTVKADCWDDPVRILSCNLCRITKEGVILDYTI